MNFLYPEFLWALTILVIPILIHLFNFRKFKKLRFSNVDLLKKVNIQTKSQSKLKHYIILALRMLVFGLLVIAFAQPTSEESITPSQTQDKAISIYVDNSFSMDTKGENDYLLEMAKLQSISIIQSHSPSDRFQIITNDLYGYQQRLLSAEEAVNQVESITVSPKSIELSQIYQRQSDALSEHLGGKSTFWLSDFQSSETDPESITPDTTIISYVIPYGSERKNNLYVDSVWFETPVRKIKSEELVSVKIKNYGERTIEFKLSLNINGSQVGFNNNSIQANGEIICQIPYQVETPGIQNCEVVISGYPDPSLVFDDNYFFSYSIKEKLNILHLTNLEKQINIDSTSPVGSLFSKALQANLNTQTLSTIDFSTLKKYDLILLSNLEFLSSGLNSELKEYIKSGGTTVVFPSLKLDRDSYNSLTKEFGISGWGNVDSTGKRIKDVKLENKLFTDVFESLPKNIDYPLIKKHHVLQVENLKRSSTIMNLQGDIPFLCHTPVDQGTLYCFSSPLGSKYNDFSKHSLFVTTLLRIAEFSQLQSPLSYLIGKNQILQNSKPISNRDRIKLSHESSEIDFIPGLEFVDGKTLLNTYDQISSPGHYPLIINDSIGSSFSFNYNRNESQMEFYGKDDLESVFAQSAIGKQITTFENGDAQNPINVLERVQGNKMWWYFILFAFLSLIAEILVIKLWKN